MYSIYSLFQLRCAEQTKNELETKKLMDKKLLGNYNFSWYVFMSYL